MKKKFLALVLSVAMLVAAVPFVASAEPTDISTGKNDTAYYYMDVQDEEGSALYKKQLGWGSANLTMNSSFTAYAEGGRLKIVKDDKFGDTFMELNPKEDDFGIAGEANCSFLISGNGRQANTAAKNVPDVDKIKYIAYRLKITGGEADQQSSFGYIYSRAVNDEPVYVSYFEPRINSSTAWLFDLTDRSVKNINYSGGGIRITGEFNGWFILDIEALYSEAGKTIEIGGVKYNARDVILGNVENPTTENTVGALHIYVHGSKCGSHGIPTGSSDWSNKNLYIGDILIIEDKDTFVEVRSSCDEIGHVLEVGTPVDPTCTEDGYTPYNCKYCDYTEKKDIVTTQGHSMGTPEVVDPTCTVGGYTITKCTKCNYEEKTNETNATGHVNCTTDENDATCHEGGYKIVTCNDCGDIVEEKSYEKTGGEKIINSKAATCEEKGYTGDKVCDVCGAEIEKGQDIDALGHTEKVEADKAATCTEDGKKGDTVCEVCKKVLKEGEKINATGHTFGEWKETKAPTATEKGEATRKCENCDEVETKELAAKGTDDSGSGNDDNNDANNGGNTEGESPETGDNSGIMLWVVLAVISAGAVVTIAAKKRCR